MKADFTRDTFTPLKHFSRVLMQQGRVQLDADWNEQMDIQSELDRSTTRDVVGPSGAPLDGGGFEVALTAANDDLTLSPGRIYVDGILCELDPAPAATYLQQPWFPNPPALDLGGGPLLAYLDVWERHITFIEDPSLREVALGGPDTATRLQTIWQVKLLPQQAPGVTCNDALLPTTGDARLTNDLQPAAPATDPCELSPAGGYRGLENQLYRVEVHTAGAVGAATFKWSRENASVAVAIEAFEKEPDPSAEVFKLRVKSLGRDDHLGLHVGDWVEVLGDETELNGAGPGTLAKLLAPVEPHPDGGYLLVLSVDVAAHAAEQHPKLRRWDQAQDVNADGTLTTAPDFIELENGVRVKFAGADLRAGDYWMFAARTGTLTDPLQLLAAAPPHGVRHHYAALALITSPGGAPAVHDCRPQFPALTSLTSLFYVSGDGQEAMPDLTQPDQAAPLPQPLRVGVANGNHPVAGARVRFKIDAALGSGILIAPAGALPDPVNPQTDADRTFLTGDDGTAACEWQLDGHVAQASQAVEAELLDESGQRLHLPIRFTANLSVASRVAYDPKACPDLSAANVRNVQDAIDQLCKVDHGGKCCCVTVGKGGDFESLEEAIKELAKQKVRDICICLLPGDHEAKDISLANDGKGDLHLHIAGCGRGTRLRLKQPAVFDRLTSFTMRELEIFSDAEKLKEDLAAFSFDSCEDVTITACRIAGVPAPGALLAIHDADHVRLADNFLEAATAKSLDITNEIFHLNNSTLFLTTLFSMTSWLEFKPAADDFGAKLANLSTAERQTMRNDLQKAVNDNQPKLQFGNVFTFLKFMAALAQDKTTATTYADLLRDIRTAAVKANSGLAVVLGDAASSSTEADPFLGLIALDDDDFFLLEGNEITGAICLMGPPARVGLTKEELGKLDALLKGAGPVRIVGLSGTLHLRSNQLTHVLVAQVVIDQLQKVLKDGKGTITGVFGRCLLTDNVIEYGTTLVGEQLSLMANKFTCRSQNVAFVSNIGTSISDSTVFVGNTLRLTWSNTSRVSAFEANTQALSS